MLKVPPIFILPCILIGMVLQGSTSCSSLNAPHSPDVTPHRLREEDIECWVQGQGTGQESTHGAIHAYYHRLVSAFPASLV